MNRRISLLIVTALLVAAGAAQAAGPLDLDAGFGVHSKYVWRGMVATDDAVLQPEAAARVLGMGFGFWGNVDMTDANDMEWQLTEVDWMFSYLLDLPLVSLEAGLIYYDIRGNLGADTSELWARGEANVLLSPALALYFDLDEYNGTHARASVAHGNKLGEFLEWELGAELGWGSEGYVNGYFGSVGAGAGAGFTDALVSLALPWHPLPMITVTPHVSYATLLSDAKDSGAYPGDATFFGVTAGFSF